MRGKIHLIAPAGSCKPFFQTVGLAGADALLNLFRQFTPEYQITGEADLLNASEDELHGGRRDDVERARDIEMALADSDTCTIIGVRGGAWFARILPQINFNVLTRRQSIVHVFGFSELTGLVNIVAASKQARGYYDMGPAFLTYGMKRFAAQYRQVTHETSPPLTPDEWMLRNWRNEFARYCRQVVAISQEDCDICVDARLARGNVGNNVEFRAVGGNLTVLSTLLGSPFADAIDPHDRWLVLEDFNDKPERFDRFLAHLTLAGYWQKCRGVLLGDFHQGDADLRPAILEMLDFHIPSGCPCPILVTDSIGHIWPMTPLPLNRSGMLERLPGGSFRLTWNRKLCD